MKKLWKTLSSKIVYENRFFTVRQDTTIFPNGEEGEYFVIEKLPIVFIVAMTSDNEVYLITQYRYTTQMESLEVPAGSSDGQDPLVAAKRELQEETGLIAKKWQQIGIFQVANGNMNTRAHAFLARDLEQTNIDEKTEEGIISVKKVPFTEALKLITSGKITDGETITVLTMVGLKLNLIS